MKRILAMATGSAVLLGTGAAAGAAVAATKLHVLSQACVATKSRAVTAPTKGRCPSGSVLEAIGTTRVGKTGATGPAGPAGPTGAPASTKTYIVNWQNLGLVNATNGVTQVGSAVENATDHTEVTRWRYPVDLSACAVEVTPVNSNGTASGPAAQAGHVGGYAADLWVETLWPGGTGIDFSLLVVCP
jgi:hypothetical protein